MVLPAEAEKFYKVWNHNGVQIILNDSHIKFATDFANVVLRNFIINCHLMAQAKEEAQNKINEKLDEKKLISLE